MTVDTGYHWQARTVTRSPYFPRSRWFTTDAKHTGDTRFPHDRHQCRRHAHGVRGRRSAADPHRPESER
jgi:hypothetical protein